MKKQDILKSLREAESFIAGFEDDESQRGVKSMLKRIRKNIKELEKSDVQTKVLITVEGGIVQNVMSDAPENIQVVVVDFDKHSDEPVVVAEQNVEKLKKKNFYELYDGKNIDDAFAKKELKKLKF